MARRIFLLHRDWFEMTTHEDGAARASPPVTNQPFEALQARRPLSRRAFGPLIIWLRGLRWRGRGVLSRQCASESVNGASTMGSATDQSPTAVMLCGLRPIAYADPLRACRIALLIERHTFVTAKRTPSPTDFRRMPRARRRDWMRGLVDVQRAFGCAPDMVTVRPNCVRAGFGRKSASGRRQRGVRDDSPAGVTRPAQLARRAL